MAAVVMGLLGLYAVTKIPQTTPAIMNTPAPTSVAQLPPMDKYNPAKNDLIRPKAWTYDPRRIGVTARVANTKTKGGYPQERFLGTDAVDNPRALWKNQQYRDTSVQQIASYHSVHPILDNTYWNKGVHPHPRINSLGNPQYYYVPPVTSSPV
jgi:hypothetical protein